MAMMVVTTPNKVYENESELSKCTDESNLLNNVFCMCPLIAKRAYKMSYILFRVKVNTLICKSGPENFCKLTKLMITTRQFFLQKILMPLYTQWILMD